MSPAEVAGLRRLSVVIANYNYERFVAAAIESALALEWPDVEVVVVDDGSTDGSRAVIERYADRVRTVLLENGGQRAAANRGFAESTGDVVVFLDSDDLLPPELPTHVATRMTPGVSKVQFQMQRIDVDGNPVGPAFPDFDPVPTPAQLRDWVQRTTAYPTPPGSGNAYARWFLEALFPVGPEVGDFIDSACLAAAPFLGDVVSVPGVRIGYRQHGENDSNLLKVPARFGREVERARNRWVYAQRARGTDGVVDESALFRSRELLQLRVAASRTTDAPPALTGDGRARMLLDSVRAPFQPGPEALSRRVLVAGWCLATLVVPGTLARRLVAARYGAR